jgi:hypothetical protein
LYGTHGILQSPISLSFYRLPRQHHKNLKSTNMLERLMEEIKRRTLVVRIFPNPAACLRLIRALAAETHENFHEQGAGCQQQKQTFISCHSLLEGKNSESRPGSVKVARSAPKGNLDGWPRSLGLSRREWQASSPVVRHHSVLLPDFHPRSDRLLSPHAHWDPI